VGKTIIVPRPRQPEYPYRLLGVGCVLVGISVTSVATSLAASCSESGSAGCSVTLGVATAAIGVGTMIVGFALMFIRRQTPPLLLIRLPKT
jgi:hypothetical protein